jgi:hypothetical protein
VKRPFESISTDERVIQQLKDAESKVKPIIVSDWRHTTSEQTWANSLASGVEAPCIDSVLVNGKGSVICLSRNDITKYTTPPIKALLGNESLTDKG